MKMQCGPSDVALLETISDHRIVKLNLIKRWKFRRLIRANLVEVGHGRCWISMTGVNVVRAARTLNEGI